MVLEQGSMTDLATMRMLTAGGNTPGERWAVPTRSKTRGGGKERGSVGLRITLNPFTLQDALGVLQAWEKRVIGLNLT